MKTSSSLSVKGGYMNEWESLAGAKPLSDHVSIAKSLLMSGLMSGVPIDTLLDPDASRDDCEAEVVCIGQQLYAESLGLT